MAWIIFLSVTGLVLVCLEVVVPGVVVGVFGVLCLVAAVVITYILYGVAAGNTALLTLVILSAVAVSIWVTVLPRTRFGGGMLSTRDLSDSRSADSLEDLRGKRGQAISPLRPSGTAMIDGQRVDVLAETGLIEEGSVVLVVIVEGSKVVVRKV